MLSVLESNFHGRKKLYFPGLNQTTQHFHNVDHVFVRFTCCWCSPSSVYTSYNMHYMLNSRLMRLILCFFACRIALCMHPSVCPSVAPHHPCPVSAWWWPAPPRWACNPGSAWPCPAPVWRWNHSHLGPKHETPRGFLHGTNTHNISPNITVCLHCWRSFQSFKYMRVITGLDKQCFLDIVMFPFSF